MPNSHIIYHTNNLYLITMASQSVAEILNIYGLYREYMDMPALDFLMIAKNLFQYCYLAISIMSAPAEIYINVDQHRQLMNFMSSNMNYHNLSYETLIQGLRLFTDKQLDYIINVLTAGISELNETPYIPRFGKRVNFYRSDDIGEFREIQPSEESCISHNPADMMYSLMTSQLALNNKQMTDWLWIIMSDDEADIQLDRFIRSCTPQQIDYCNNNVVIL